MSGEAMKKHRTHTVPRKYLVMGLLGRPDIHDYERTSRAGLRVGFRADSRLDR
jgi:hypothetical protein